MKGEDRWRGWKWQRDQLPNQTVFYSHCVPPLLETLTLHWNGLIVSRPARECSSSLIAGAEGFKMRGGEASTKAFCCSRGVGLPAPLSAVGSDFMCCMCWPKCNQPPLPQNIQLMQEFEGWRLCMWFLLDKWGLFVRHSEHSTRTKAAT